MNLLWRLPQTPSNGEPFSVSEQIPILSDATSGGLMGYIVLLLKKLDFYEG